MKYSTDDIKLISLVENITRANVKDYFDGDALVFIIAQGELRKAIGDRGANVKRLEQMLKKRIKLVEHSPDLMQFIKNVIAPNQVSEIKQENKTITLYSKDLKNRGYLIGRAASTLRTNEKIVKQYFDIEEIKVI
jgi:transcription termination/antitermination protein NusA